MAQARWQETIPWQQDIYVVDGEDRGWYRTGSARTEKEHFFKGKFVVPDEWRKWDGEKTEFIPDYACFHPWTHHPPQTRPFSVSLPVSHLKHVTDWEGAREILRTGTFKGKGMQLADGLSLKLSFWSAEADPESVQNQMRDYLAEYPRMREEQDSLLQNVANSDAFQLESRFGNYHFTVDINELTREYEEQFGPATWRIMGTLRYPAKVSYVVVCFPEAKLQENEFLQDLNTVPAAGEGPIRRGASGAWTWCPYSTGNESSFYLLNNQLAGATGGDKPQFRRWDDITFAFYLEDCDDLDMLSNRGLRLGTEKLNSCVKVKEMPEDFQLTSYMSERNAKKLLENWRRE